MAVAVVCSRVGVRQRGCEDSGGKFDVRNGWGKENERKRERARERESYVQEERLCGMMRDRKRGGSVGNGGKNCEERGSLWDES